MIDSFGNMYEATAKNDYSDKSIIASGYAKDENAPGVKKRITINRKRAMIIMKMRTMREINRKKICVILSVILIAALFIGFLYYSFYYSYEIVKDGDWRVEFYQKYSEDPESVDITLTEKEAVRIADYYLKNTTDRKYEVYYDKENNWYYVHARYTETRHNWFDRYSEWVHMIVIDKSTGEIKDLKIVY